MKTSLADNNAYINHFTPSLLMIETLQAKKKNQLQKALLKKQMKQRNDALILIDDMIAINLLNASNKAKKQFNKIRFQFA